MLTGRGSESGFNRDTEWWFDKGKTYRGYGITSFLGHPWYYLDGGRTYYPEWSPSPLFQIVDGRVSRHWVCTFRLGRDSKDSTLELVFREWAEDPYFYDSLTDGNDKEVAIYRAYKEKMDLEFPSDDIETVATPLADEWVMCPICTESTHADRHDGWARCQGCRRILHNPFYDAGLR